MPALILVALVLAASAYRAELDQRFEVISLSITRLLLIVSGSLLPIVFARESGTNRGRRRFTAGGPSVGSARMWANTVPAERDLQHRAQTGDRRIGGDQQAPTGQRTDAAHHHPQRIHVRDGCGRSGISGSTAIRYYATNPRLTGLAAITMNGPEAVGRSVGPPRGGWAPSVGDGE